ncbi:hypothetical protein A9Q02_00955 [Candidatus Chloroploca asiatica]|uniref:YfhO family protein n=2 Tax=Candidatus Chloroploca asiatica TaxID=1506545 RepID=A0A2H3KNW3_9CHLR|nr:hypothetical protein A9Q02_00955 [Candidatus Chloroploca asiatica]
MFALLGILLILVLMLPSLLPDNALLPADLLFDQSPWQAVAPTSFHTPGNNLLVDQVFQFYPWRLLAIDELHAGRWPLWNPLIYAGTPLVANDQSAVFYPINLLLAWMPPHMVSGWSALFRLWTAFGGMYILLRHWKQTPPASFVGGMSFALGAFTMPLLGHPHTNVGVWLPWMLLTADKVVFSAHPWRWVGWGAVVISVQFLGGHAETSFFSLMLWGIYSLAALIVSEHSLEGQISRFAMLAISFLIGSGIAAVQLIPFLELLPLTNYYLARSAATETHPWLYTGFWRNVAMAITLFLPDFFGNPTRSGWWIGTGFGNYTQVLYMGIAPLFLAGIAALEIRRTEVEWRVRFFTIFGLIWLGVLMRLPILDLLQHLPLFNIAAMSIVVFSASLAILAGYGFDAVFGLTTGNSQIRTLRRALLIFGLLTGGGLLVFYAMLRLFKDFFLNLGRIYVEERVVSHPPHPFPLPYYLDQLETRYQQITANLDPLQVWLYAPVLVALTIAVLLWGWNKGKVSTISVQRLIGLLVFVDLWAFGAGFNPVIPATKVFPPTPALSFLNEAMAKDPNYSRILALSNLLPPNTLMPYNLPDARGYDVTIGRYTQILDALDREPLGVVWSERNDRFFDLVGVRYLLTTGAVEANTKMTLVYDGEIKVYERTTPLPRAYLVSSASVFNDDEALLNALLAEDVAAGQRVLLEEPPPFPLVTTRLTVGTAQIIDYQPDKVEIAVETSAPALLVLSDAYFPGWRALVDGVETPILRTNYAFRGVPVSAGVHNVIFIYNPISFKIGFLITISSLGVLVLLAATLFVSRNEKTLKRILH